MKKTIDSDSRDVCGYDEGFQKTPTTRGESTNENSVSSKKRRLSPPTELFSSLKDTALAVTEAAHTMNGLSAQRLRGLSRDQEQASKQQSAVMELDIQERLLAAVEAAEIRLRRAESGSNAAYIRLCERNVDVCQQKAEAFMNAIEKHNEET